MAWRPITAQPRLVARDEQVRDIIDFIRDPARRLPVIIASFDGGETDVANSAIDAHEVAYRSVGLAHVVILTDAMTYRLSDWWGKEYSVFQRAVRVYQPGFNPYEQTPFDHPLYVAARIEQWPVKRGGPFEDELIRLLAAQSVQRRGTERDFPSYQQVKQAVLRQRREAAQIYDRRESEIVRLLEQELEAKTQETEELMALGADAENARDQMKMALDEATRERRWLRHRVDQMEAQLKALNHDVTRGIPIPGAYDGLADWAAEHLAGRLVLLPRAARAAKDADFSEPQLAYRALLLLANDYREMRLTGGQDATARFNAKLRELGLRCTPSGERASILQHAEEFVVHYNGRKELLDWHLKNGNARDPTRCFRCYFFWDAEESMVVVGSLPGHLTTALT